MFLIFRAMISSYYWVKSLNKSSEGKHKEALLLLEKASINRTFYDEIYYSHKGFLLAAIGNKNESLINFNKALEYSNSKKSKLNKDEKFIC